MSTKTMRPPPRRVLTATSSSASSAAAAGSSVNTNSNITNNKNVISNISGINNVNYTYSNNICNKRKEREESFSIDRIKSKSSTMLAAVPAPATSPRIAKPNAPSQVGSKPGTKKGSDSGQPLPHNCNNQLLFAGYLAHEFLSKGTLFGQVWDPTRSDSLNCSLKTVVSSDRRSVGDCSGAKQPGYDAGEEAEPKQAPALVEKPQGKASQKEEGQGRYREVATLLMSGGAHFPGIVNPSQLARFLHL